MIGVFVVSWGEEHQAVCWVPVSLCLRLKEKHAGVECVCVSVCVCVCVSACVCVCVCSKQAVQTCRLL